MKEYTVRIKETLAMDVKVVATSAENAVEKVEAAWKNSEYVLTCDDFQDVDFDVVHEGQVTEDLAHRINPI